jgi:hypothetical protein
MTELLNEKEFIGWERSTHSESKRSLHHLEWNSSRKGHSGTSSYTREVLLYRMVINDVSDYINLLLRK